MTPLELVIGSAYFFLPAGFANMAPSIAAKALGPGAPIDFGRSWGKHRIFGDHKTWQGLAAGIVAGALVFLLQQWLYQLPAVQRISIIDYSSTSWLLGAALGFGALAGDALKSFFKRRVNIPPGKSWIPFDQTDYVIGGMLMTLPFVTLPPASWIVIFLIYLALHVFVNLLGYWMGIKENML